MKSALLSLALILVCSTSPAATLTIPTLQNMDSYVCVGGTLSTAYTVTSTDPATGYITGLVFGQDRCSVHSGRVTSTGYHSVCSQVVWDGNGTIVSIEVLWSLAGRLAVAGTTCLNPS